MTLALIPTCRQLLTMTFLLYRAHAMKHYEISRCTDEVFSTVLCDPDTVIHISDVIAGASASRCSQHHSNCRHDYRASEEYYKRVVSQCDGQRVCRYLWAETRVLDCLDHTYSTYITIRYTCRPSPRNELAVSRCSGAPFDTLLCPLGSTITVVEAYSAVSGSSCEPSRGDCAVNWDPLEVGYRCDDRAACYDLTAQPRQMVCGQGAAVNSTYSVILYTCREDKGIRWSSKCSGQPFSDVTSWSKYTFPIEILNIFVGATSSGCGSGGRCLRTLESVAGVELDQLTRTKCTFDNCSSVLAKSYPKLRCPGSPANQFTLIVYRVTYVNISTKACIGSRTTGLACDKDVIQIVDLTYIHTTGPRTSECITYIIGNECLSAINRSSEYYQELVRNCSGRRECREVVAQSHAEDYVDLTDPRHCRDLDVVNTIHLQITYQCVPASIQIETSASVTEPSTATIPQTSTSSSDLMSQSSRSTEVPETHTSGTSKSVTGDPTTMGVKAEMRSSKLTQQFAGMISMIVAVIAVILLGLIKLVHSLKKRRDTSSKSSQVSLPMSQDTLTSGSSQLSMSDVSMTLEGHSKVANDINGHFGFQDAFIYRDSTA